MKVDSGRVEFVFVEAILGDLKEHNLNPLLFIVTQPLISYATVFKTNIEILEEALYTCTLIICI